MATITPDHYKGTKIGKLISPDPEQFIRKSLADKLEKGVIDQPLYESALKELETILEKGGEGSKGGKIIGHTKSGDPIYDTFEHSEHKGFTKQDHHDAAVVHSKEGQKNAKDVAKYDYHWDEGGKHVNVSSGNVKRYKHGGTKETINKAEDNSELQTLGLLLEKAGKTGEGSRGGQIIGHTRTGKPIYDHYSHSGHSKFNEHDHEDAARFHGYKRDYNANGALRSGKDIYSEEANRHDTEASKHIIHRHALRYDQPKGAESLHDSIKRTEADHVYGEHIKKYANMSDKNRDKYRSQIRTTHEVGMGMKSHKSHEDFGRHEGHSKFLEATKHGITSGDSVKVKNTGAEGKVGYHTHDGHLYVKMKDGSDGHFHGSHLQKT